MILGAVAAAGCDIGLVQQLTLTKADRDGALSPSSEYFG